MTSWPASLPWLLVGLTDEPSDNVLRTEMPAGPAKVRRRWTVDRRLVPGMMLVTGTQRATLDNLYANILTSVLPFTYEDPDTGSTANYRFATRPRYALEVGHDDYTKRVWRVTATLEILP